MKEPESHPADVIDVLHAVLSKNMNRRDHIDRYRVRHVEFINASGETIPEDDCGRAVGLRLTMRDGSDIRVTVTEPITTVGTIAE